LFLLLFQVVDLLILVDERHFAPRKLRKLLLSPLHLLLYHLPALLLDTANEAAATRGTNLLASFNPLPFHLKSTCASAHCSSNNSGFYKIVLEPIHYNGIGLPKIDQIADSLWPKCLDRSLLFALLAPRYPNHHKNRFCIALLPQFSAPIS